MSKTRTIPVQELCTATIRASILSNFGDRSFGGSRSHCVTQAFSKSVGRQHISSQSTLQFEKRIYKTTYAPATAPSSATTALETSGTDQEGVRLPVAPEFPRLFMKVNICKSLNNLWRLQSHLRARDSCGSRDRICFAIDHCDESGLSTWHRGYCDWRRVGRRRDYVDCGTVDNFAH